ncbi:ATP-binding protein [Roseburia faecis]|jgi:hypothetical protein|uniref:ATP-binding protein n=1 Tax=Roseburia faecis TaxID=301302 RepID=UPI0032EC3770
MELLLYQLKFMEKLIDKIHEGGRYILIKGKSGSGKSFTLKQLESELSKDQYQIIIFDGDYQYDDREYYPFKKALFLGEDSAKELIAGGFAEASKEIPVAGNIISYIIKSFIEKQSTPHNLLLNSDEQNILAKLRQILKKPHIVLIFDNIHWWDRRSLQLLKLLLTNKEILNPDKLNNFTTVFSMTTNQSALHADLLKDIIDEVNYEEMLFPVVGLIEFKNTLFNTTLQNFSDTQINLLFNLVNGHLQVLFEVINEINNHNFDFNATYESNKQYLSTVLEKRLKEYGADSTQILKTLEYAAIIGITFSVYELRNITKSTENEIKKIIAETSKLTITEQTEEFDYIKFAHDIIREIFKTKVEQDHTEYYYSLALCIKEIKPDQYLRRARYCIKCLDTEDAVILYMLEAVKQIRLYGKVLNTIFEEMSPLMNSLQKEYLKLMQEAYCLYSKKEYKQASSKLSLILDIFPAELLAERDILKIRCFSKTMASNEIQDIITKSNNIRKNNTFNGEKDIWERYSQVVMIAFAHLGEITLAREVEDDTLRSLSERLNYDDTAKKRLNIIKRVANSIHNIDVSAVFVKDAFDYFGNSLLDIRQYYICLGNYTTILINQGDFEEAYNIAVQGFEIEKSNADIEFPRIQLIRNNYILAGYLSGYLDEDDCIHLYEEMLSEMPIISERLFYNSNLSIFWALKDNPQKAFDILHNEALLHYDTEEKEGLYQYRVVTNTAIYQHLLGQSDVAVRQLNGIRDLTKRLINGSYFSKRNELLIQLMESGTVTTGKEWLKKLFSIQPTYQDLAWQYFGLGYAFMAVCNWDMSE